MNKVQEKFISEIYWERRKERKGERKYKNNLYIHHLRIKMNEMNDEGRMNERKKKEERRRKRGKRGTNEGREKIKVLPFLNSIY
ncbi:unnamed protein product [Onchocerca flexuosa]|uniref:Uncharacterized protein n=1 Tax=Onchocerca flexuosa TaxID=387005 RepID=A0A183I4H6_9BILA|nr:unnamed protein product [Onchocerca flexuosa]